MILQPAFPDYCLIVVKIHNGGGSEILSYEYKQDGANNSEDPFLSDGADDRAKELDNSIEALVLVLNEPEKNSRSSDENQLENKKISTLSMRDAESLRRIVKVHPAVTANSFEDLAQ